MINPSSVRSGHSGFVQTSSENLSGWRLQCLWATYSSIWSPTGLRSFLMMTQNFPCCSFGGRTSFAPPLSNQPPGCASSTSAFSCSGKKKNSQLSQLQSSPFTTCFFPAVPVCQALYCTANTKAGHSHGHHSSSALRAGEALPWGKNPKHRKSQDFLTLLYLTAGALKMNLLPTTYSLIGNKVGNCWKFPWGDQHHKYSLIQQMNF